METNDYVGYQTALALKKCGFDEPCRCCYIADKTQKAMLNLQSTHQKSDGTAQKQEAQNTLMCISPRRH